MRTLRGIGRTAFVIAIVLFILALIVVSIVAIVVIWTWQGITGQRRRARADLADARLTIVAQQQAKAAQRLAERLAQEDTAYWASTQRLFDNANARRVPAQRGPVA